MKKLMRVYAYGLLVGAFCAACVGCATYDLGGPRAEEVDASVVATFWDGPKVRPGVMLIVQVGTMAAQPNEMTAIVDQKGEITLPYLLQEPIQCNGLSLEELKQKVVEAYSFFIRQPQVMVTFAPIDRNPMAVSPWGTVTVLGEVLNPGPVNMPSTMDFTVTKVLQAAGGLKPYADRGNIRVTRCDKDGKQTRIDIDLNEIGKDGRIDKDILVRAGDVVYAYATWY